MHSLGPDQAAVSVSW